jgi:toxin ParE1/3/4
MAFSVRFTIGAQEDLRALHAYIAKNDSEENADYVARGIVRAVLTLKELPERGAYPAELLTHGVRTYRQIFFKPYRILYRIRANTVLIAVIADGRRDMAKLLARRLGHSNSDIDQR